MPNVDALLSGGFGCRALLPRAGPLREALEERRVPVVVLPFKWWTALPHTGRWRRAMRTGWNVVLAAWLAGRLRAWGCDLVYSNTLSVFVGALAARMARRPHVWHVHELGLRHTGALFDVGEQRALRLLDRWSDTLVACSRAVEAWLAASVPPEKIRVVYQSVPAGTDCRSHRRARVSAWSVSAHYGSSARAMRSSGWSSGAWTPSCWSERAILRTGSSSV